MRAKRRILIVGGYGVFGFRAAERLSREPDLEIVIAGRSLEHARAAAASLAGNAVAGTEAVMIDATKPDAATLAALGPTVVINASGPFQAQDFTLARAAISAGAHYIDLADAADFVIGFARDRELDASARARGVLVTSGASSVPAISGAVLDQFAPAIERLKCVRAGISPGNSFDPGPATTASILSAVGQPFRMKRNGAWTNVHGWQGLSRHHFPAVGPRWMGYCNVPDLQLFAERYPDLETVEFSAGVEVSMFHLGLWALSWPSRWGWLRKPERFAVPLLAVKRQLSFLGSDIGCMFVELEGADAAGAAKRIVWHLVARQGHGPYIPTTPAVILAKKLVRGEIATRGAQACVGLVTLAEIENELADLAITMSAA